MTRDRALARERCNIGADRRSCDRIEPAGSFIEDQKPWIVHNSASQCDALALSAGEHGAAFTDDGVHLMRLRCDEFPRARFLQRALRALAVH